MVGREADMVGVMGEYGGAVGEGGRSECWLSWLAAEENEVEKFGMGECSIRDLLVSLGVGWR